jgi:hypothetical protein
LLQRHARTAWARIIFTPVDLSSPVLTPREKIWLIVLGVLSLGMRAAAFFRYRFDSDEPQHLHVAWGWTAGLVQYRDLFDNHTPLFHMLSAPLLAVLGERSNILLYMRGAMLPLFVIVLSGTWVVADRIYGRRAAWWSIVLLSLFPPFFLKSLEYRTDNLWTALWMVVLISVTGRRFGWLRAFGTGLLLGLALCVSMKTTLLLITLGGAALVTWFCTSERQTHRLLPAVAALFGFAVPPAILANYFARLGAWDNLLYCVFEFNALVTKTRDNLWIGRAAFPLLMAIVLYLAWRHRGADPWRHFFAVAAAIFTVTLLGFWVLITPRDFLPLMPLLAVFAAARLTPRVLTIGAIVCVASLFYYADGFRNRTAHHITMIDQVLRVSRPDEPLMDIKGETIYRRRPFYFIFEAITRAQMESGMIRDTIPEAMIAQRCHIAQADGPMLPPRGRAWLSANFLDLGRIRVSGHRIDDTGSFTVAVPGEYVILSAAGHAAGTLDGLPYTGARELAPGMHRFQRAQDGEQIAALWAPAFARGHSPFHLRDLDF